MAAPVARPPVFEQVSRRRRDSWYLRIGALTGSALLILLSPNIFRVTFADNFLPHVYCFLGRSGVVWTHVISDLLIGTAYFAISGTLAYIVYSQDDIPFRWMFFGFTAFIVSCGLTHIVEAITVWFPIYVFQGGVKVVTAATSLGTAALLPFTIKPIRRLVDKAKSADQHLLAVETALAERNSAQAALQNSYGQLELRVRERTEALVEANRQLENEIAERMRAQGWVTKLAAIVEYSEDAILSKTLDGTITTWNNGAERLYGYAATEIVGQPISVLIPRERSAEMQEILDQVRWGNQVEHFETVRVKKNGRPVQVSVTVSPIKNPAGQVIGASTIARDITNQKLAEESVRRSEEQYRFLFESNPMPMWVFDVNSFTFLAVNEAAVRHYGYSRKEFLAMTVLDIRPEEDVRKFVEVAKTPVRGLSGSELWRHRKKDGTIIDVEITSHDLILDGREAELVLANDVTERKRNEQKLLELEERYSKAFRSSPLPITISTFNEGRYLECNHAFLQMLGFDRDEIVGRTAFDVHFWPSRESRARFVKQVSERGRTIGFETQILSKAGEVRTVLIYGESINLSDTRCILAIINDVTESKRLEEQLRQAQRMEAVGRLAGGVAHDFNNVLGVIIGYSELAQGALSEDTPVRQQVAEIKKAADRGASLTRQLLAFSRQQILQPSVINLNTVIENLSNMLRRMVAGDVEVSFGQDPELGNVYVDRGQMDQILMNLAVNARDAMPEGGKLIIETANADLDSTYAEQHAPVRPGPYVRLTVTDTGTGMDAATMSRIFEPFFTTKTLGHGTGLGLSIVYGIVKQSGGYIWVYSEVGRGTTFKIYFPRLESDAEIQQEMKGARGTVSGTETILLVEDDEPLRKLTQTLLQENGYQVMESPDGGSALKLAEGHEGTIHLLLSDVIMAQASGPELASKLRALRPGIKVLYMSGYTGDLIARHGGAEAGAALVEKPFTREALLIRVREVLGD